MKGLSEELLSPFLSEIVTHYGDSLSEVKEKAVNGFIKGDYKRAELFANTGRQMVYFLGTYGQRCNPGIIYMERIPLSNAPENEIRSCLRTMPSLSIERVSILDNTR